jgi:WD40 repeat protein
MFIETGVNQTARLRDAATGKTLGPPLGRDDVSSAAFCADGSRLAVGGFDGKIALWDAWSPIEGSPELVRVTIELFTGKQWVSHELVGDLSADDLEYRRLRLKELSSSSQNGE